ncbi:CTP synthase [Ureaplasma ceti]|uniref:CTP synthase (glutamine hydrolyzing) n=1 Tax=Ureaplasma ceti TaxID=3119530 RepID=A0ABP9U599_9BACT
MKNTKFIFVTGGVYSSLGKGITASSIGRTLKQLGFSVTMQKLDPYLNVNPSNISPYQHGEVFVTEDGAEADLDLGNYERFVDHNLNKYSTVTSGRIYSEVIENERKGLYNGKTVQVVPHITGHIISKLESLAKTNKTDFAIVEIGGTIGDIESLPFIEAINEFCHKYGKSNVLFAHCVPLISIATVFGELKTKPAQHSVKVLRSLGVSPDLLLLRVNQPVDEETIDKLSWSCSVSKDNIFVCPDLESTYFLPEELYKQQIYLPILKHFNLKIKEDDFKSWLDFTDTIKRPKPNKVTIALVGEYVELHDAYFSVKSALELASYYTNVDFSIKWLQVKDLDKENYTKNFRNVDGVIVAGADHYDAQDKTIQLFNYLAKKKTPTLAYGTAIESFILSQMDENAIREHNAYHGANPIFVKDDNNQLILGLREDKLLSKNLQSIYGDDKASERHRHLYKFNLTHIDELEKSNVIVSGVDTYGNVDFVELANQEFFVATYANPEFTSKPTKPNPLYVRLLELAKKGK